MGSWGIILDQKGSKIIILITILLIMQVKKRGLCLVCKFEIKTAQ